VRCALAHVGSNSGLRQREVGARLDLYVAVLQEEFRPLHQFGSYEVLHASQLILSSRRGSEKIVLDVLLFVFCCTKQLLLLCVDL